MVGLIISDKFLLCGFWEADEEGHTLSNFSKINFTDSVYENLYNEKELNSIIASSLRRATESHPFDGQNILVGLLDDFVEHGFLNTEKDLTRADYIEYYSWIESKKKKPARHKSLLYGQVYLPNETTVHFCSVSQVLVRTLKLTVTELGGNPHWMGPVSSLYLDGSGMSEAALIQRIGNRYSFLKIQDNRFDMGKVAFSNGVPKVISTTDSNEMITLSALGLIESELDDIPVFCPQKLGRQALIAWESSDIRVGVPFEDVNVGSQGHANPPHYEGNLLTALITSIATDYSFNFFEDPGITEFLFTEVFSAQGLIQENDIEVELESEEDEEKVDKDKQTTAKGFVFALIVIVGLFFGANYMKLNEELNKDKEKRISVERIQRETESDADKASKDNAHRKLLSTSKSISSVLLQLLTETDLSRYVELTIDKSFIHMEYISGENPNVETILEQEPTYFSVEPVGEDSTVFTWYYSFDLLPYKGSFTTNEDISKNDLMVQLDTFNVDYSMKYFESYYTANEIYGPLLIKVNNIADILQTSAMITKVGNEALLRKFRLKNKKGQHEPIAGFYVSILKD